MRARMKHKVVELRVSAGRRVATAAEVQLVAVRRVAARRVAKVRLVAAAPQAAAPQAAEWLAAVAERLAATERLAAVISPWATG